MKILDRSTGDIEYRSSKNKRNCGCRRPGTGLMGMADVLWSRVPTFWGAFEESVESLSLFKLSRFTYTRSMGREAEFSTVTPVFKFHLVIEAGPVRLEQIQLVLSLCYPTYLLDFLIHLA